MTTNPDGAAGKASAKRVGVIVLGMHRSGTSALTRMLSLLGCSLPRTLMPANPTNPEGHWEPEPVAQFNDEVFAQAGTQWDDWLPVNPRLSETLIWPTLVARGREILRDQFGDSPLFVLKDPRICKLAGFWLEVLAAEGIEPAIVLPLRNPLEVARSLATRDGSEEYRGLLIWLRHVLAAEAATRGRRRVYTAYADLLGNWEGLAARLSEELGVIWPRLSVFSAAEVSQFLTPDMRHHVSDTGELGNNPAISSWVARVYEVLLAWAKHGEQAADYPSLDAITRSFDDAGPAFVQPLLHAQKAVARAAHAEAASAALSQDRDGIASRLDEVQREVERIGAEHHLRTVERDAVSGELAAVTEQLAGAQAAAAQQAATAEDRDRIAWRLGEAEAELQAGRDERDRLTWRLGEVDADLGRARSETEQTAARAAQLENELATAGTRTDSLEHRLAVTESTLRQREEEITQIGAELKETQGKSAANAAAAELDRARLSAALGEAEEAVQLLRQALSAQESAQGARIDRLESELAEARAARHEAEQNALRTAQEKQVFDGRVTEHAEELARLTALLVESDQVATAAAVDLGLAKARLDERFAEIVHLTGAYRDSDRQAGQERQRAEWLRQVHKLTISMPRWWAIMPKNWRRKRELERFDRRGLFRGDAYLSRYPDVEAEGMDPLRHYILHGMAEGRSI